MSELKSVIPYTQDELDQQAIWGKEFDQWWETEGKYHRAGGNDCRTFAWFAWLSREQSKQSEIDKLKAEKEEVIKLAEKWMAMVNGDFGLTERLTAYNYGSELMRIFKKPNSKNVGG